LEFLTIIIGDKIELDNMASYELLYYYNFRDIQDTNYKVHIYKYIDGVAIPFPTEIRGGDEPFIIELYL